MFDINSKKTAPYPTLAQQTPAFVLNHYETWAKGLPVEVSLPPVHSMPTILSIGGGKGGVGKSIISANIAALLAQFGYRVLVVDLDLGCSNLHTHFGISMPKKSLADFILTKKCSFRDILLPTPVQGVAFVAGGREEHWNDALDRSRDFLLPLWAELFQCKQQFKVDFVVLDLGAGTHRYTMDFYCSSHIGLLTVLPEPTSIENAYVFLKMMLWNLIDGVGRHLKNSEAALDIQSALSQMTGKSLNHGYAYSLKHLQPGYTDFIATLSQVIQSRFVGIIVNQTRDQSDMDIGHSMEHICQRYFGLQTRYLGYLNYDQHVLQSLRNRRLLISDFSHCMIAKRLAIATSQILNLLGMQRRA